MRTLIMLLVVFGTFAISTEAGLFRRIAQRRAARMECRSQMLQQRAQVARRRAEQGRFSNCTQATTAVFNPSSQRRMVVSNGRIWQYDAESQSYECLNCTPTSTTNKLEPVPEESTSKESVPTETYEPSLEERMQQLEERLDRQANQTGARLDRLEKLILEISEKV